MEESIQSLSLLTPRQIRFMQSYLENIHSSCPITIAYMSISKTTTRENAQKSGSRLLKRIKEILADDWDRMLDAFGLGEDRLLVKLNQLLEAQVTKFYREQELGNFSDNMTQMRATELLAEFHGKKGKALLIEKEERTTETQFVVFLPQEKEEGQWQKDTQRYLKEQREKIDQEEKRKLLGAPNPPN